MQITLATFFAFAGTALAGRANIQCQSGAQNGGRGMIPAHHIEYSFDGGQSFICSGFVETCGEMQGQENFKDTYVNCLGDEGGYEDAAFWITSDGCYNVCAGGNHMYCCNPDPGDNDGGVCYPSGWSAGC